MAQLTTSLVNGDLRVTGNIYGNSSTSDQIKLNTFANNSYFVTTSTAGASPAATGSLQAGTMFSGFRDTTNGTIFLVGTQVSGEKSSIRFYHGTGNNYTQLTAPTTTDWTSAITVNLPSSSGTLLTTANVTSTYSSSGTSPVNGTAVASAISGKVSKSGDTMTGALTITKADTGIVIQHGTANKFAGITMSRTDTSTTMSVGISSSNGTTHGLYSSTLSNWIVCHDGTNVKLRGLLAPSGSGNNGQVLISKGGSTASTWTNQSALSVGSASAAVSGSTLESDINLRGKRVTTLYGVQVSKAIGTTWYDNMGVSIFTAYGGAVHRYDIGFRLPAGTSSTPLAAASKIHINRSGCNAHYAVDFQVWYKTTSDTLSIMVFTPYAINGVVTYDVGFSESDVTLLTSLPDPSTGGWSEITSNTAMVFQNLTVTCENGNTVMPDLGTDCGFLVQAHSSQTSHVNGVWLNVTGRTSTGTAENQLGKRGLYTQRKLVSGSTITTEDEDWLIWHDDNQDAHILGGNLTKRHHDGTSGGAFDGYIIYSPTIKKVVVGSADSSSDTISFL